MSAALPVLVLLASCGEIRRCVEDAVAQEPGSGEREDLRAPADCEVQARQSTHLAECKGRGGARSLPP